jgi:hypothetical protein
MSIFEQATRQHLKYQTKRGLATTEDLWDLPLVDLDQLAVGYRRLLKDTEEESFIKPNTKVTTTLQLQFEIVRHIIEVKLQEQQDRQEAAAKRARNARIREIMAEKKDAELSGKSYEELEKLLEE